MTALRSLAFNLGFWTLTVTMATLAVPWVVLFRRPLAVFRLGRFWVGSDGI